MSRLTQRSIAEIQKDRIAAAGGLARERNVCVVLKGEATVIAWPDGEAWINPTGTPAMATGGTGDVLTGILAGLLAQFPGDARRAVAGAVWLHGRAGELAARQLGEQPVIATDLLLHFPEGIRGITQVHDDL
jgi:NAD(P)H-hydrate epimerase